MNNYIYISESKNARYKKHRFIYITEIKPLSKGMFKIVYYSYGSEKYIYYIKKYKYYEHSTILNKDEIFKYFPPVDKNIELKNILNI